MKVKKKIKIVKIKINKYKGIFALSLDNYLL